MIGIRCEAPSQEEEQRVWSRDNYLLVPWWQIAHQMLGILPRSKNEEEEVGTWIGLDIYSKWLNSEADMTVLLELP